MKFFGQFNPPVDKVIYETYFKDKYNGISIEAGAFDGIMESSTYFFNKYMNWTTINIEPLPNVYETLCKNRTDEKSININIALSNTNETQIIRNYKHPQLNYDWGNASICHTDSHKKELEKVSNNEYIEHSIQCMTYKNLIEKYKLDSVDLFVLDVEGYEYNVLQGMKDCEIMPDVFVIEHGHLSTDSIYNYLKMLNDDYKLDTIVHNNSYFSKI
jgi:FkbM family methyltransferase